MHDFDGRLDKLLRGLTATRQTMTALVHGDLIPVNILVGKGRPALPS